MLKAEKEFILYSQKFDLKNENIKMKQLHSIRVMKICEKIAKEINLNKEEINLAKLIGLLHDIGRFMKNVKHILIEKVLTMETMEKHY